MELELDQEYTGDDYKYSRPLDIHLISHHPEVKTFLKDFQQRHFPKYGKKRRPLLDVLLMDLYVNWYYHPDDMFIGFHRNDRAYSPSTRYNKLRITRTIIQVLNDLVKAGFVFQKKGFRSEFASYNTRIKALPPLEEIFEKASINALDIFNHEGRETILLKDLVIERDEAGEEISRKKNIIEYEDTNNTIAMREDLRAYNDMLQRTHVDLGNRHFRYVERKKGRKQKKAVRIPITQNNKFVYRVFNNSSWEDGGRFYGGWWQQISEEDRRHLRLNGERTIEVDYSGIHIHLLYARKNMLYQEGDPYTIDLPEIADKDVRRWLVKQVLLVAVNAENVDKTCKATRKTVVDSFPHYYDYPDIKLTDDFLTSIIDKLKAKHPQIAEFICTGAGIELQNDDSKIASKIINGFVKTNTCILSVHDSFIVPEDKVGLLQEKMQKAFQEVAQVAVYEEFSGTTSIANAHIPTKQGGYYDEAFEPQDDVMDAINLYLVGGMDRLNAKPNPDMMASLKEEDPVAYEQVIEHLEELKATDRLGGEIHLGIVAQKEKELVALPAHKARLRHFQQWLDQKAG